MKYITITETENKFQIWKETNNVLHYLNKVIKPIHSGIAFKIFVSSRKKLFLIHTFPSESIHQNIKKFFLADIITAWEQGILRDSLIW